MTNYRQMTNHDTLKMRQYISAFLGSIFLNLFLTCEFSWVQNKKVTERLLHVWDDMKQGFAYWEKLRKLKRPPSKSYETVKKAIGDLFIVSKLHFFTCFRFSSTVPHIISNRQTYDSFCVPISKGFGIKAIRDNC